MPRKPPERKKPCEDCRRVLSVSSGKRERSTVVPGRGPGGGAVWRGGGGGWVAMFCFGDGDSFAWVGGWLVGWLGGWERLTQWAGGFRRWVGVRVCGKAGQWLE